jgi:hypothetical protein
LRAQPAQRMVEAAQVRRPILHPNVDVERQFRQMAKEEIHPADEQVIHSLVIQGA